MNEQLILRQAGALREKTVAALLRCNDFSVHYGLVLSQEQMQQLAQLRTQALRSSGRIEFGEGILPKLVRAFCSSPFIQQADWAQTLAELQMAFYHFKNESGDTLSDDELIEAMAKLFNGRAQGSIDFLLGTALEELCRIIRGGFRDE